MLEFANGVFNPGSVAFMGVSKDWRGNWLLTLLFVSGASWSEQFSDQESARRRLEGLRQEIEGVG